MDEMYKHEEEYQMADYVITTDSNSDVPEEFLKENQIPCYTAVLYVRRYSVW